MATAPERRVMINQIRNLPKLLQTAVKGLTPEQLDTTYRDGGWTVAQVVHHLADSHMNAYLRMKLILTEENPPLKGYSQDAWAALPDATANNLSASITILKGLHKRWVMMLKKVQRKEWNRTGQHSERGAVTLESLLQTYSHHGDHHLGQITALRQARGW